MDSRQRYELQRKELLSILENENLSPQEKMDKMQFLELLENLEIYQAELQAQNVELQEQEQQLIKSRDEFEQLFSFAPIAYLQLDKKFNILKYNKNAKELLSIYKIKEQKIPLNLFVHTEDLSQFCTLISDVQRTANESETLKFFNNQSVIHGKVNIKQFIDPKGEIYYLCSILDVTKEIEQEALLLSQAKNAAMGEMLSMITHQWKQPLSVISMMSTFMETQLELGDFQENKFKEHLRIVREQIQYMDETAEDFKSFFDENKEIYVLNVKECIKRAVKFTKASLKKYSIDLDVVYNQEEKYKVQGFRHDICQILMTIINNAKDVLKNKEDKKNIILKMYKKDTQIVISITNNGGIIKEDNLQKIFEKNFTTNKNEAGRGLGLYIAKKIVQDHLKGTLEVRNIDSEDSVEFILKLDEVSD